ncbi:tyrosine-protein kinase transmembrane receptor Ror [Bradysia coprophila]|uniref:tyrosine-protein kinase transmembrane receptor Ror n=1 Tax=Bradysia coprophila TaxID=38358 RepID=UPI00187DA17D|nr:tyrosine-protein kinase transmembrane receptor Ror [Bradysia coprophila]
MMSARRNCTLVVILCCLHGITMGIVNDSYSKESSETIEIAPIPPNLFTDISAGKNDLSTEISLRINDEHDKDILNGTISSDARSETKPVQTTNKHHVKRTNVKSQSEQDDEKPQLGVCQTYTGSTCDMYLRNQTVFIPPHITIDILEERLKAAYGVIKESKDMNPNCRGYALPSLCYSILPICRTPEKTNHQYFANKANAEYVAKKSKPKSNPEKKSLRKIPTTAATTTTIASTTAEDFEIDMDSQLEPIGTELTAASTDQHIMPRKRRSFDVTVDARTKFVKNKHFVDLMPEKAAFRQTEYPPTRSSENLRRICREDCELLENELCQKEYAIAKRHPTIGQKLPLEDCYNLPEGGDCSKLGIVIDVDESEKCYWENGSGYRGTVAVSKTGKPCLKWARLMKEISDYPELAGQNYCRNPGSTENQPWCYVDSNQSLDKATEHCDIPKCSEKMWLYIILSFVGVAIIIIIVVSICCCKKYKKRGMTNIQNINLPNVDKNIYGNSRLNSPIEMTSLLPNQSNIPGIQQSSGRNTALRVTQYTLGDVKFVEELGEGAFGKVYKGELTQTNGEKIFVAVKALKENASAKTQADFKREIELISDLKHANIVCILGVVLKEEPLCMLFEYMTQGDLHEFLIANSPNEGKSLSQLQFLQIAMQISEGMEYLSSHHYVHRDLAARNCLVGDSLTVKISDFGLSRDIYSSDYYRVQSKSLLPVRWMPSESILYGKFTTESDIWSFGVVLFEIYSYGLQPYYGYSNQEVISMVRARQLLPCPEVCPSAVYSLMVECWHEQAVRRPSFPEIGHRLKIWYQAQKRSDQSEISSNCPSRKGSTFSVVNRQSNSITPSTSSHHITVSSRERDMDGSTGNGAKDVDKPFGANHSLDRGHSHSHSHSHHHHHHHHSLDRDGANFTNLSCSASTRGQLCNTPPSSSVVAKSRSSTSNSSLTTSNHMHSSEEQLSQHRKSNIDASGSEWNETMPVTGCSRGGSDRSRPMMKPPKDPKSTNHHHHSRHKLNDDHQHQHHHQHQHRKKSVGSVGDPDGGSLGGMRKISAAGSVSSVLSENSMASYSKSRTNSNDFSHKLPAN